MQTFLLRSPNLKARVPETESLSHLKYGLAGLFFDRLITGSAAVKRGSEKPSRIRRMIPGLARTQKALSSLRETEDQHLVDTKSSLTRVCFADQALLKSG